METPYDVLGVPRNANDEMIRAAFRKAAKAYHPDLNAGDPSREKQFKQVSAAYELLKTPRQRAAYDEGLSRYERYLKSVRRKRIWRFARVPVAAIVSGVTVVLGVSLSSGPPAEPARGEIAQRASHDEAVVHDSDDSRPAASYTQAKASPAKEWKRVGASSDPMAVWGFALRNPRTPEAKLARSKLIKLIDTTDNAFTLHVLSMGAGDAIAKRAQQRLNKLDAPTLVEEASHIPASPSTLEERATRFVSAQISGWSSTNATELASFANAYADQVLYYGSLKSRQAVLVDKRHLLERWPERLYEVKPDSVTVQCVVDVCKVSGLIDWQTRSPRREASANGIARFEYQIIFSGDAFSILSERSSVVRPTRTGY
jgi:DnaJ domain